MKKIMIALVAASMWYVGVVQAQQATLFRKWSIYTSDFFGAQKLNNKLSQVILYREAGFIEREVADIYIDGKYYMFLLANSYKPIQLCAQTHLFGVALNNSGVLAKNKQVREEVYYTFPAQQTSFIKVIQRIDGTFGFEQVDSKTGEQAINGMSMKKQILPKITLSHECKEKTVLQHFVLSAKTLFKNGRGDLAGMLPEARSEMDDLVVDLKKLDQRHISHIVISGNSAQEESRDMSKKLSAERAKTILYFLQQQGVHLPMEVTGYGDQQLVSRNCALRNPIDAKMREACEQSNRRVEITIYAIQ